MPNGVEIEMRPLSLLVFFSFMPSSAMALEYYIIQIAHNDEVFIINGEKYEAQTYCLGWEQGERVIFLEGSPFGACASASLYNIERRETCDVWCE